MVLRNSDIALNSKFFNKVYGWMFLGLALSGVISVAVFLSPEFFNYIVFSFWFWFLIIAELGLVILLSARINKMKASTAKALFIAYAALNGLTLSVVLFAYTAGVVFTAFFITAGMFGAMSIYGILTKKDLSGLGAILFMGLIGLIISLVVNIFLRNPLFDYILGWLGVLIFTGLTLYDTKRIKDIGNSIGKSGENVNKAAIMGALKLYLDFINLLLSLLRVLGRRR